MLLLALLVAALLRFWGLDRFPSGLYRDEAFNGLDALKLLDGQFALYFPANNGREPLYIYLTSIAIAIWGQTLFAVRAAAALAGTLTTLPIYLLGRAWFGWRTGLLAAWIWAITLWPVHLSRIGLRTILVVPILVLTFWLATEAYRRQKAWIWGVAGLIYGLGFYTYLAFQLTPLLLLLLVLYLLLTGRARYLWPGALAFLAGVLLILLPLVVQIWWQPDLFLGRSGQVSILNPDVYETSVLHALAGNITSTLGMFLWRGDSILRHNPAGRPVFDPLLAIPFLLGLAYCLRSWRKLPAAALLLWLLVMLAPTLLAADAPHFLRAAGVLPALVLLPALGLACIWQWPRLPSSLRALLVAGLLAGSLLWTITDYLDYARDPRAAYAFEAAATELAQELIAEDDQTDVYLDDRLWSSWPSLEFLLPEESRITRYLSTDELPDAVAAPAAIYTWPYDSLDYIPRLLVPPALVTVQEGALTKGDLEESAYPLYVRYGIEPLPVPPSTPLANFAGQVSLQDVHLLQIDPHTLQIDIYWTADEVLDQELIAFVHVSGPGGLIGQQDLPIAAGRWQNEWWQPDIQLCESRTIELSEAFDSGRHSVTLGLYNAPTGERLPLYDALGDELGTTWSLEDR